MPLPAITRVSNMEIKSDAKNKENGLRIDAITTTQRDAIPTKTAGLLISNSTNNTLQTYQNGVWNTLNATASTATGVGLTNGTAFTLPSGPSAAVEVLGNQVAGFMYNDTTLNRIRVRANAAWNTVTIVPEA